MDCLTMFHNIGLLPTTGMDRSSGYGSFRETQSIYA